MKAVIVPVSFAGFAVFLVLAFPFIEIAGFILIGARLGAGLTILLQAAAMLAGFAILRRGGLHFVQRLQAEVRQGRVPALHIADGALLMVAGLVFTVPGLVKDVLFAPLLLPGIRQLAAAFLLSKADSIVVTSSRSGPGQGPAGRADGPVVDLDPSAWSHAGAPPQEAIRLPGPDDTAASP